MTSNIPHKGASDNELKIFSSKDSIPIITQDVRSGKFTKTKLIAKIIFAYLITMIRRMTIENTFGC